DGWARSFRLAFAAARVSAFILVEVAEGLEGGMHSQGTVCDVFLVAGLVDRLDLDVLEGDDAQQRGYAANKRAQLVIRAHDANMVGECGVELLPGFAGGLEQFLIEPAGDPGLSDVIEQIGNFAFAREL